ncbi:tumor necrosis factor ligand superfamily member 13B [Sphaeramia orbicularis]|uniref:THD domain-containing protein n=1 Tax=Sphaeramia orbicularis TaxID=375764 RepID=A0A673B041_9TELE|nr:tumor necrosis factor ligand superfamily member 13B [Sphaeramia orbicularis]
MRSCYKFEISEGCQKPAMAALASVGPGTGRSTGEGRLSWPVFLLMLAAVTSSSLSALSLYKLVAVQAELEGLKSDFCCKKEGQEVRHRSQNDHMSGRSSAQVSLHMPESENTSRIRKGRMVPSESETFVSQPCLQFLANSNGKTFNKDFDAEQHTGIPWQTGLIRGSALEEDGNKMLVRQAGYYFVYSQVYYTDRTFFAMGHVVIRWKRNVVGNEAPHVVLFRCIQNMSLEYPFNTCYTGGIVKLEVGDHLELLIPRPTANVSLDGEGTFMGALKLA